MALLQWHQDGGEVNKAKIILLKKITLLKRPQLLHFGRGISFLQGSAWKNPRGDSPDENRDLVQLVYIHCLQTQEWSVLASRKSSGGEKRRRRKEEKKKKRTLFDCLVWGCSFPPLFLFLWIKFYKNNRFFFLHFAFKSVEKMFFFSVIIILILLRKT